MVGLDLEQGLLIAGRYRLQQHLGEGGMGTVWSAVHAVTRRAVAIKLLRGELQHRSDLRKRFLHEARAASALSHPNVIEVLDVFELEDQSPVMVMELLEGETLGQRLARDGRLSLEETVSIMLPVIDAVADAHAAGVVHRDLKPENIFLTRSEELGWVKVLDFGIAKLSAEHYLDQSQSVSVTQQGAVLGTPRYMAPEQINNQGVDYRADIWSLGTILYECLSGTRPIEGDHMAEVVGRLLSGVIVPLAQLAPDLPPDLSALVQQMLARDPARRPQDIDQITDVLARYERNRPSLVQLKTAGSERSRNLSSPARASVPPPLAASSAATAPSASPASEAAPQRATGAAASPAKRSTRWLWFGGACLLLGVAWMLATLLAGNPPPGSLPNAAETARTMSPPTTPEATQASPPAQRTVASSPARERVVYEQPAKASSGKPPAKPAKRARRTPSQAPSQARPASQEPSEEALFSGRK